MLDVCRVSQPRGFLASARKRYDFANVSLKLHIFAWRRAVVVAGIVVRDFGVRIEVAAARACRTTAMRTAKLCTYPCLSYLNDTLTFAR